MSAHGKTLKIFIMSGELNGLQLLELGNWSGRAFLGERKHIKKLALRDDLEKTGLYVLFSTDQNEEGVFKIYIGETDAFTPRITNHLRSKDWWDKFIVFTSGDDNLSKAHVKFLEKCMYDLAQDSLSPTEIMNSSIPGGANLSEAEVSYSKTFLDNCIFIMETLGLNFFTSPSNENLKTSSLEKSDLKELNGKRFYLNHLKEFWQDGRPVRSYMKLLDDKFVIEEGAYIRKEPTESFKGRMGYYKLWLKIIESGAVVESEYEGLYKLTKEVKFNSASAAGSVLRAKSTNGLTKWISCDEDLTLKEILKRKSDL